MALGFSSRPLWLFLIFATAICYVSAQNNSRPGQGIKAIVLLLKGLQAQRTIIEQGNFQGFSPLFSRSGCFANAEARKDFFDDIGKPLSMMSSMDDDLEDAKERLVEGDKQQLSQLSRPDDDMDDDEDDDILEKLSDSSLRCLVLALNNDSVASLCRQFSHGPGLTSFKKLLTAGVRCVRHLRPMENMNDDDDDDIDDAQQRLIMNQLRERDVAEWDDDAFDDALDGAPDLLDSDLIDDLDDDVFERKIKALGKLLQKGQGGPGLANAVQQKLRKIKPLNQLTKADINNFGAAIRAFDLDDIDDMDDDAFDDSDLDFDDLDDDEPLGMAIGRKLRRKNNNPAALNATSIKRLFKFIKNDRNYINRLNPQAVVDSLDDIGMDDLDDDEASAVCKKVRQSDDYDDASQITAQQITKLGKVLKGCGVNFLVDLPGPAVQAAMNILKTLDLEPSEARELYGKLNLGQPSAFNGNTIRTMSHMLKGLSTDEIDDIPDSALTENLDLLDDIDFDDIGIEKVLIKKIKGSNGRLPAAVLKGKFREALSLEDIDDIDDDDLAQLTGLGDETWEPNLAYKIVKKLRGQTPGKKYAASDFQTLGKLAVGVSEEDIDDLLDDQEEIFSSASVLGDLDDDLSDGKSEAMAKKIKTVLGTKDLDDIDAIRAGPFIIYLDDGEIEAIKFTLKGGKAFANALAKMSGNKLPLKKLQYLAQKSKQLIKAANNDDTDDLSVNDITELRGSLLGLSPAAIRGLSKEAFLATIEEFSKIPISKEQGEAIIDKIEEYDDNYKCKGDRLAQIGSNLKYLSADKINALCESELATAGSYIINNMKEVTDKRKKRIANGLARDFTDDGTENTQTLVRKIQSSLVVQSARRKRAVSSVTCDQIKTLFKQSSQLPPEDFTNMADAEFTNCLSTLGQICTWTPNHLTALVNKAKQVVYGHTTWNTETIKKVGSIVAGLTPLEIKDLALTSLDTMASTGKYGLLSMEQLKAGFATWLSKAKSNTASSITGTELSALSEYVCGAEVTHIQQLSADAVKQALRTVGDAKSCSHDQLKEYAKKTVAAYGAQVNTWDPTVISDMGRTLGGLESQQISQLQASQINVIKTEIIPRLPSEMMGKLSVAQLQHFSTNQVNAVTSEQFKAMPASLQTAVKDKATITFTIIDGGPNDNGVAANGPLSFMVVLIISYITKLFI